MFNQISPGNEQSFFSGARSINSNGGGIASRINNALSRIVWSMNNNTMNEDDNGDVSDLISLIEELNKSSDLTVKLNNHSKILRILTPEEPLRHNIAAAA